MVCKYCSSIRIVKNGRARGKQRYRCKDCTVNFVTGDRRINPKTTIKRAFSVILYSFCKASFGFIGKLFGVSRTTAYKWICQEAAHLESPQVSNGIKEMEFDELWHFVQSKKTKDGSSKRMLALEGKLLPGLSAVVILRLSNDCMTK